MGNTRLKSSYFTRHFIQLLTSIIPLSQCVCVRVCARTRTRDAGRVPYILVCDMRETICALKQVWVSLYICLVAAPADPGAARRSRESALGSRDVIPGHFWIRFVWRHTECKIWWFTNSEQLSNTPPAHASLQYLVFRSGQPSRHWSSSM